MGDMTTQEAGRNMIPLGALRPHPRNYNRHPQKQIDRIAASLRTFGQRKPITTWRGYVLTGHGVYEAAKALEWPAIWREPCPEEWSEAQALAWLAADNELGRLAEPDEAQLAAILEEARQEDAALLEAMGYDEQEFAGLLARVNGGQRVKEDAAEKDDPRPALIARWGVESGQLWALGEYHRLICGDCTDPETWRRVMGGERAHLGVTSPPYAVGKEYETGVSFDQHLALLRGMADRALECIEPGGFLFVNFGEIASNAHAGPLTGSARQCVYPISKDYWTIFHEERRMDLYASRIWYKPFHRLQQPFWTYHTSIPHHQEWETLWTWQLPGDPSALVQSYLEHLHRLLAATPADEWERIWTWRTPGGAGDQVQDWDISVQAVWDTRNEATDDKPLTRHVAAFPVCLPERAIRAHSAPLAIVWEPFSGSGTTLMACHNWYRRCRAAELDPGNVAVTLQRYQDATGDTPRLVEPAPTAGRTRSHRTEARP
jgi:hypothetical protein